MATIQIDSVYFKMPVSDEERCFFDVSLGWLQRLESESLKIQGLSLKLGHDLHERPSAEFRYIGLHIISLSALSVAEVEIRYGAGKRKKMNIGDVFGAALCPLLGQSLADRIQCLLLEHSRLRHLVPLDTFIAHLCNNCLVLAAD